MPAALRLHNFEQMVNSMTQRHLIFDENKYRHVRLHSACKCTTAATYIKIKCTVNTNTVHSANFLGATVCTHCLLSLVNYNKNLN